MAASRAICSVWWPMKLGLAHSVACLGSRFRGLCYQLWNLRAAKLRVRVCVYVHSYACVWFGLSKLSRDKCLSDPGLEFQTVSLHSLLAVGGPARAHRPFWVFLKVCFLASAHGIPVVELRFQSFSWPMTFFKKGQGIYHTFCVYIYVIYHTMNC